MSDRIDRSNGRRGFLKKLLGAVVAPKVAEAVPVPEVVLKPRSVGASMLAHVWGYDAMHFQATCLTMEEDAEGRTMNQLEGPH